ncbi:hypothetical protein [Acuticoccus mangrovi]|uniref:Uncharacterized protein n=1 Tax=Acuticoccus mangrovi TaxID=2796142 RepID=A0A934MGI4_9HYPH|nr:hypothetical protein [Acuticoccus mangrovi]MBJ3775960.1 hypothetical protein [Acuticoccus mangrovi]
MSAAWEVVGRGPAAALAAAVFANAGQAVERASLAALGGDGHHVLVSEATLRAIARRLGNEMAAAILKAGQPIAERRQMWGAGPAARIACRGVLVTSADLVAALARHPAAPAPGSGAGGGATVAVFARGRRANGGALLGTRRMVEWSGLAAALSCEPVMHVVAGPGGWATIARHPANGVVMQVVCAGGDTASATGIAHHALEVVTGSGAAVLHTPPHRSTPAAPQFGDSSVLCLGEERMALDPLAGDGLGHVLFAAEAYAGLARQDLAGQLAARRRMDRQLADRFTAHLVLAERYYGAIAHPADWRSEVAAMANARAGLERWRGAAAWFGSRLAGGGLPTPLLSAFE